jgi:hypothetical protein
VLEEEECEAAHEDVKTRGTVEQVRKSVHASKQGQRVALCLCQLRLPGRGAERGRGYASAGSACTVIVTKGVN